MFVIIEVACVVSFYVSVYFCTQSILNSCCETSRYNFISEDVLPENISATTVASPAKDAIQVPHTIYTKPSLRSSSAFSNMSRRQKQIVAAKSRRMRINTKSKTL